MIPVTAPDTTQNSRVRTPGSRSSNSADGEPRAAVGRNEPPQGTTLPLLTTAGQRDRYGRAVLAPRRATSGSWGRPKARGSEKLFSLSVSGALLSGIACGNDRLHVDVHQIGLEPIEAYIRRGSRSCSFPPPCMTDLVPRIPFRLSPRLPPKGRGSAARRRSCLLAALEVWAKNRPADRLRKESNEKKKAPPIVSDSR